VLSEEQIAKMAALLPQKATGTGPACSDRQAWGAADVQAKLKPWVTYAESLLNKPFPAWSDDAYLTYSRTGSRGEGEAMLRDRFAWFDPLVLAECAEAKGRFIALINATITELVKQPTWTLPAHDIDLLSFHQKQFQVELRSADFAHSLAQNLYLLGNWVTPPVRQQAAQAMRARVFDPILQSLKTGLGHGWLKAPSNWNAVCTAGVTGAALAGIDSLAERAVFAASAERSSKFYIEGFPADGYATEGLSYWNFGFSWYAVLRQVMVNNTRGSVDLFAGEKIRAVASFGPNIQMRPGVSAAFGDSLVNTVPDAFTMAYVSEALAAGPPSRLLDMRPGVLIRATQVVMMLFPDVRGAGSASASPPVGTSHWFADAGVLVSRAVAAEDKLAATFKAGGKGGGNGGHSHNDLGSYAIASDTEQPVGDVGKTNYTAKTFSKDRYQIRALSSYGHPVPLVAGQLQRLATDVQLATPVVSLSAAEDVMAIELAPAYAVPALKSLKRTFRHTRAHAGAPSSVSVDDQFEFSSAQSFETALTTLGSWRQGAPDKLLLTGNKRTLEASIEASGPWELVPELIKEEGLSFTRLGIRLKTPSAAGFVRVRFVESASATP
jgi:hypothetical protein